MTGCVAVVKFAVVPETTWVFAGTTRISVPDGCFPPLSAYSFRTFGSVRSCVFFGYGPARSACGTVCVVCVVFVVVLPSLPLTFVCVTTDTFFGPKR